MASFAASLLDELMGRNRNVNPNEKSKDIHWSDSEVCRYFLCGFCPHELFTNTRADLGPCSKIHDEELAKKYASSSRFLKMGYEEEFLRFLQDMIGEIDRKIRRGHQRLELNKSHTGPAGPIGIHQEKLKVLSDRITELVEQAEKLGCEGRVEEAQGVLKLCDQLKEERAQLQEIANSQMMPKEMEVCPVCGAFLVVGDAPQRVEEHVNGKQHVGYNKVRATIENLKKRLKGEDPEREARLQRERDERDMEKTAERERKDKGSDAEKRDGDSREKDRREKEPDKRDRKEDRNERSESSRKRSRSRSHSRHGSKRSRSRSHDKHRRSRSHGKERRSRSGDRDRHHRSRDDKGSSSRHSYSSNGSDRRASDRDRDRR